MPKDNGKNKTVKLWAFYENHSVPRRPAAARLAKHVWELSKRGKTEFTFSINAYLKENKGSRKSVTTAIKLLVAEGYLVRTNPDAIGAAFTYKMTTVDVEIVVPEKKTPKAKSEAGDSAVETGDKTSEFDPGPGIDAEFELPEQDQVVELDVQPVA